MSSDLASSLAPVTDVANTANTGLKTISALTQGASSGATALGGIQKMGAANVEAGQLEAQGNLEQTDAQFQANQTALAARQTAASQAMEFVSSGVSLQGTPLSVLASTINQAQLQVNQQINRGNALKQMYMMKAQQQTNAGRSALIGSAVTAGTGALNNYVQGKRLGIYGQSPTSSSSSVQPNPTDIQDPGDQGFGGGAYNPYSSTGIVTDPFGGS